MSSNGIYVYDIKHGTPKTYEEAHEILDTLSGFKESAPNPNMAAFGRNLMNGFLRQAWQFYEGDESLAECLGIEHETARMLSAKYCFEFPFKQRRENFNSAIIRAACENNWWWCMAMQNACFYQMAWHSMCKAKHLAGKITLLNTNKIGKNTFKN